MARARITAGKSIKRKQPKSDKKVLIMVGLNLLITTVILLKLIGVI